MNNEPSVAVNVYTPSAVSGAKNLLIFDPDEPQEVYLWWCVGSGQPEATFNGRHLILGSVKEDVCAESLQTWLESEKVQAQLLALAAEYEGTTTNRQGNIIGQWTEEASSLAFYFEEALELAVSSGVVARTMAAEEWFDTDFYSSLQALANEDTLDSAAEWAKEDAANVNVKLRDIRHGVERILDGARLSDPEYLDAQRLLGAVPVVCQWAEVWEHDKYGTYGDVEIHVGEAVVEFGVCIGVEEYQRSEYDQHPSTAYVTARHVDATDWALAEWGEDNNYEHSGVSPRVAAWLLDAVREDRVRLFLADVDCLLEESADD